MHNYGCLLWEWRKDFKNAEEVLTQAIRLNPGHQATVNALVELREERARAEKQAAQHAHALLAELELDGGMIQEASDKAVVAKSGAKKARRRKKKKGVQSAFPDDEHSRPAFEDPAAGEHQDDDGLPGHSEGAAHSNESADVVSAEARAKSAPLAHLHGTGTRGTCCAQGHASGMLFEVQRGDAGENLAHRASSAPHDLAVAPCLDGQDRDSTRDASHPSTPLFTSLLAYSPPPRLCTTADVPSAQMAPPKTPAAMRSWLLSLSNSFEENVVSATQAAAEDGEEEEVEHLIDDHGIMHVITPASVRAAGHKAHGDQHAPRAHHTYAASSSSGILPTSLPLAPAPHCSSFHRVPFPPTEPSPPASHCPMSSPAFRSCTTLSSSLQPPFLQLAIYAAGERAACSQSSDPRCHGPFGHHVKRRAPLERSWPCELTLSPHAHLFKLERSAGRGLGGALDGRGTRGVDPKQRGGGSGGRKAAGGDGKRCQTSRRGVCRNASSPPLPLPRARTAGGREVRQCAPRAAWTAQQSTSSTLLACARCCAGVREIAFVLCCARCRHCGRESGARS